MSAIIKYVVSVILKQRIFFL